MSSWTFETFEEQYKDYPQWHISASYRWNKGNTYETYVGVFNEEGVEQFKLFNGIYGSKESAKKSFQRQVRKIKKGELL